MRRGLALALLVVAAQPRDLEIAPAADYLVRAFDRVPLVAFSEPGHGAAGTREFLAAVLAHPQFAGRVHDVVVEFGNARYQALADRYVAGEAVSREDLRQIWENTTVVTGVWTAPMYAGFLDDVRSVNGRTSDWVRGTQRRHEGRIRAGGVEKDVTFVEADADLEARIDEAYRQKYRRYAKSIVGSTLTPRARSAALKLVPQE